MPVSDFPYCRLSFRNVRLPSGRMILANRKLRWYIPYSDDKQDLYVEKSIAVGLPEKKLG